MSAGIFKIIFDGLDISTLGTMALAIVIVSLYKKRTDNNEHYEFALVDATISDSDIVLIYRQIESYKNYDLEYRISKASITTLEYSDRLCCLRICGKIIRELHDGKQKVEELSEHYLYLEKGTEIDVISAVRESTCVSVKYMDR